MVRAPRGRQQEGLEVPDIFDEVEEDLRAERARKLAQRWGGVAFGVALLVLAATGAWQVWRWNESRSAVAAAETYLNLHRAAEREGADLAPAANGFATLAREAPTGYRTLARLRAAALKAETGELPAALDLWNAVANDGSAPSSTATSPPCSAWPTRWIRATRRCLPRASRRWPPRGIPGAPRPARRRR